MSLKERGKIRMEKGRTRGRGDKGRTGERLTLRKRNNSSYNNK